MLTDNKKYRFYQRRLQKIITVQESQNYFQLKKRKKHLQGLQCHQSTTEFSLEKGVWRRGQTPPTIVVSTIDYTSPEKPQRHIHVSFMQTTRKQQQPDTRRLTGNSSLLAKHVYLSNITHMAIQSFFYTEQTAAHMDNTDMLHLIKVPKFVFIVTFFLLFFLNYRGKQTSDGRLQNRVHGH